MATNIKLNEIDINNLHLLSKPAKLAMGAGIILLVMALAYFALFRSQLEEIDTLKQEEITLKDTYTQKSVQAANFDALKEELAQIRSSFDILLKQLPTDAEIPNLIQELHQAGATNGMRMNSVTPVRPIVDGPIQKMPYKISLSGSYDQLSQFTRDVGKLSRIVTLDSLNLRSDKGSNLILDATANTYKATETSIATGTANPAPAEEAKK